MKTKKNEELIALVAAYNNGDIVESVEMGGMGDGYEAAIQTVGFAIMESLCSISVPAKVERHNAVVEKASIKAMASIPDMGYSGAQVGAAQNMAAVLWRYGVSEGMNKARKDCPERIIRVRKEGEKAVVVN